MATPKEKGDVLEHAVHQIEEVIHRAVPGLTGAHATIERNKHIVKNHVTYENDVLVTIHDPIYPSTHVIECKNWNKPVGTEEVLKLKGKMEMLEFASGTIIARDFTTDAIALAAQCRSLKLDHFSDNFWSPLDSLSCAATTTKPEAGSFSVHFRNAPWMGDSKLDYESTICRYQRQHMSWDRFSSAMLERHLRLAIGREPRFHLAGLHHGRTAFDVAFGPGELFINDLEIARMEVWLTYTVDVKAAKISAKFDVEHRGGFIRMEYPSGTFGHDNVALEIVTKPSVAFKKTAGV